MKTSVGLVSVVADLSVASATENAKDTKSVLEASGSHGYMKTSVGLVSVVADLSVASVADGLNVLRGGNGWSARLSKLMF
jgi:hypothetical protein